MSDVEFAWTGEGLPPVGTVCEASHIGSDQGVVRVLYSGEFMVLWNIVGDCEQCGRSEDYQFRPIRTPEQIAAEEREKAIDDIAEIIGSLWSSEREAAEFLYKAGYRKTEAP